MNNIEPALAAHKQAILDLEAHQQKIATLKQRSDELEKAIAESRLKASKPVSAAALSIAQIKKVATDSASAQTELSALEAALQACADAIQLLEREQESYRLNVQGAIETIYRAIHEELLNQLDRDVLKLLALTGLHCGKSALTLGEELFLDWSGAEKLLLDRYGVES